MSPSTSPNDPFFYLNHCNEDRIWESWMQSPQGMATFMFRRYPHAAGLNVHCLNDTLNPLLSGSTTPAQMLAVTGLYTHDSLSV